MEEKIGKLRSKSRGGPSIGPGEQTFTTEAGFVFALQTAWRAFATDISASLPDGTQLVSGFMLYRIEDAPGPTDAAAQ